MALLTRVSELEQDLDTDQDLERLERLDQLEREDLDDVGDVVAE